MKVKRYNKTTQRARQNAAGVPMLSVDTKKGVITLNRPAVYATGLQDSDFVELWQDEENPDDWYLVKTNRETGIKVRAYASNGNIMFNSVAAARAITSERRVAMQVSKSKIAINSFTAWPIITASAKSGIADRVKELGN